MSAQWQAQIISGHLGSIIRQNLWYDGATTTTTAGSPGPRIAWPLATERTRSFLRACEPATHHCWKSTPISSTHPQTPCVPFAKRGRRRLNTGYGGAPGSMQQVRTYLEVLHHPSRSLPPTLKGCWRSQGSPSGRPLALKPQQQQQKQQQHPALKRQEKKAAANKETMTMEQSQDASSKKPVRRWDKVAYMIK